MRAKFVSEQAVPFLSGLNNILEQNGTGYYVGDKVRVCAGMACPALPFLLG